MIMKRRDFLATMAATAALSALPARAFAQDRGPAARVAPVSDDYYGTTLADPYRWM